LSYFHLFNAFKPICQSKTPLTSSTKLTSLGLKKLNILKFEREMNFNTPLTKSKKLISLGERTKYIKELNILKYERKQNLSFTCKFRHQKHTSFLKEIINVCFV